MKMYFLGIAGTAMGSLAILMKEKGHTVWGTDVAAYPPMKDLLEAAQIKVYEGYDPAHLDEAVDLVVIGNALSRGNPEVERVLNDNIPFTSLPALIERELLPGHRSIVITGTHGKTTTTALMVHVLRIAGEDPTFMVGGVPKNLGVSARLGTGKWVVLEGDEYDTAFFDKQPKFLHYFPYYLIINNIEFDHADIYSSVEEIKLGFRRLLRLVPGKGLVVANVTSEHVQDVIEPCYSRCIRLGSTSPADLTYRILPSGAEGTRFEVLENDHSLGVFSFPFPGEFQVQNALAVFAVARDMGIPTEVLHQAFATFQGVRRRMEEWGHWKGALVVDDFAHHPTAIQKTLRALRNRYAGRRIVALFEPRTNTTVRNIFQGELTRALAEADAIVVAPVHRPERFPPAERLSVEEMVAALRKEGKEATAVQTYSDLIPALEAVVQPGDVLVILTNGSLGGVYQQLRAMVQANQK